MYIFLKKNSCIGYSEYSFFQGIIPKQEKYVLVVCQWKMFRSGVYFIIRSTRKGQINRNVKRRKLFFSFFVFFLLCISSRIDSLLSSISKFVLVNIKP
jgi:hypothetical protein